jgi:hypothetical protein
MDGSAAAAQEAFRRRYGVGVPNAEPAAAPPPADAGAAPAPGKHGGTNETSITIVFRAVSLTKVSGQPEADKAIAFSVLQELQQSPLFDKDGTTFSGAGITPDEQTSTVTFGINARLKRPLKL